MYLRENIALAINGLRANKMRALLTMLGIIIGISSVITIVTVGDAMTGSFLSMMNDMGANSIQLGVVNKPDENGEYTQIYGEETPSDVLITDNMVEQYRETFVGQIKGIQLGENVGYGTAKNGHNSTGVDVSGLNADAFNTVNVDIIAGRFLSDREVKASKNVAVISDKFVEKLFPGITPSQSLGREIKVSIGGKIYTFSIVGVYQFEMTSMMTNMVGDVSTQMYIPVTVSKKISDKDPGYNWIQVKAESNIDMKQFTENSEKFFNRFYKGNTKYEISSYSMDGMIKNAMGQMDTMKLAIGVIAAISLLVGGIGVMNIMLVSVTERTREIGTRKALGARNSAIRVQFIVESVIICMIGGIIGVLLGSSLGYLGSKALEYPSWPSMTIIVISVSFSMAIGVFFGYYPANKAAKLDPIEALRYE